MRDLFADLRFAVRQRRRRPVATAAALVILAIGLGATTAVFTVVQAVLLRPLPYPASHQLVTVWTTFPEWRTQPALSSQWDRNALSYDEYSRLVSDAQSLDLVAAAWFRPIRVQEPDGTVVEEPVARGSVSLLGLLDVKPVLGRWFLPGEEGAGAPHLAVLPHRLWQAKYGGDATVVGRTIAIDGQPFEIIGVLPADFHFGSVGPFARAEDDQAIWVPIGSGDGDRAANSQDYEVTARLRAGLSLAQSADEIRRVVRAGRDPAHRDARVATRIEAETGASRAPLVTLLIASIVLLGITCATLAALLLGEASRRSVEMRTRLALGAQPGRLVRQILTESTLLASAGALLAVPVSAGLVWELLSMSPDRLPRESTIATGWSTLAFAWIAALVTGALFGIVPARTFSRSGAAIAGGERAVTSARARGQRWMIAIEAALSMMLLVAAGLLVRSLVNEQHVAPGFMTERRLAISVAAPASPDHRASQAAVAFFSAAADALRDLPGVEWVTATTNVPFGGNDGQWAVSADPSVKLAISSPNAQHDAVEPGYFEAMGIPIVTGRAFDDTDLSDRPRVAVINQTMARQLWPGQPVVGRQFLAPNGGVRTIVGVAADVRDRDLSLPPRPTFYESDRQLPVSRLTLVLKTTGAPDAVGTAARRAIRSVNSSALVERVETIDQLVDASMKTQRYRVLLLQFFGIAALVVTAIGLGGVALHAAVVRRRELCLRIAVGASSAAVRRLVLSQYAPGLVGGVIVGGAAAAGSMRMVSSYFFGVTWYDPATYAGAAAVLLTAASSAGWLALRRVDRTDLARELAAR